MSERKHGPIRRFFQAIWDTVNFTRRLVFNAIFLLILLVFVAALFGGGVALQERTALVLAPHGELVEQFSADPASRAFSRMLGEEQPETQLRDVLRAIDAAARDARIERLVIRPDALGNAGFAGLREVGKAIAKFKESGKQVVAYADYMEQKQYYLAAQADEVYLHPAGALMLEGLSRYRAYYREGLQEKLGVDVHLFRVGEYKSAAEPYILDAPSPESTTSGSATSPTSARCARSIRRRSSPTSTTWPSASSRPTATSPNWRCSRSWSTTSPPRTNSAR